MKKLMMICAPVTSRSGYGDHARDLVLSFMKHNKYDIHILDVPWGSTPRNALDKIKDKKILDCILTTTDLPKQPDVYVDIRIPNEFGQHGKFNIGITAGIETTAVSQAWLDGCNKMDLIIVPSEHSKTGFVQTIYDKMQPTPDGKQQKIGELKLEKPMEVLFEGVEDNVYKPLDKDEIDSEFFDWLNNEVPEKFAYLFVGLWGNGPFGEDRKDIGKLIKVFYEAFANKKKQPALILKTNGAAFSVIDYEETKYKIKDIKSQFPSDWKLPNVYLLHGEMSDEEINYLYNHPKMKSFVSLTHGEGFGRPLLEATMTGLPVIASGWSGHLDFLDGEKSLLLPGNLQKVPQSQHWEDIIIPESKWFIGDEGKFYNALNFLYSDYTRYKKKAEHLMDENRGKFTLKNMSEKLDDMMEKYMKNSPQQVSLNLPKLKKINTKSPEIKLPKLKKITEKV